MNRKELTKEINEANRAKVYGLLHDEEPLRPCKCGGQAEVIGFWSNVPNRKHYFVRCSVCKQPRNHRNYRKREKAIEDWNENR